MSLKLRGFFIISLGGTSLQIICKFQLVPMGRKMNIHICNRSAMCDKYACV